MSNDNQDKKVMSASEFFKTQNNNVSKKQNFLHVKNKKEGFVLKAFNYMFADNMFTKKAALFCLFAFIANSFTQIGHLYAPHDKNVLAPPIYYVLISLGVIASFIPAGYGVSCVKSIREQNDNIVLPFVHIIKNFVLGLKCMVGIFLTSLIFGIICVIIMIIPAIITGILGLKVLFVLFLVLEIFGGILLISIYLPALCCIFAEKEWLTSFFRFIRATKLIAQCKKNYFKYAVLFIILMLIVSTIFHIVQTIFLNGLLGAILAAAVISVINSYIGFVFVYIAAKSITVKDIG